MKRSVGTALATAVAVLLVAVAVREVGDLAWSLELTLRTVTLGFVGFGLMMTSDVFVHVGLTRLGGVAYRDRYADLVDYFEGQSAAAIAVGGVLAGAEELLFRGVVLQGAIEPGGLPVSVAIAGSAVLFGAAHAIPSRRLVAVSVWAGWEGVLLGLLYVMSGSLVVPVVAHGLHDVAGFTLFRWHREHARTREPGSR